MHLGAEKLQSRFLTQNEAPAPMFKLHSDPRFVGIGQWLSNTGLDELPQLINILRGEMSFIGPRPLPIAEAKALLQRQVSWRFRQAVKPGILSEWSLDNQRHRSLKHWQALDKLSVQNGGLGYELGLIVVSAISICGWTARPIFQRLVFKSRTLLK
jgi:lipopolysaccharide/colanic/teichoic acid biosynthesis glycosyltransferase